MPKHKRNNMATHGGNMETIIVASGNQALASGSLVDGTTSYNIANGQLGVLSWDHAGATSLGDFVTAGQTVADVAAVKVIQGTPKSSMTHTVDVWEASDKDRVESGIIHRNGIRSVTSLTTKAAQYSARAFTDYPTILDDSEYLVYIDLDGVREDRRYGDSSETIAEVLETPSFATVNITDSLDWTLQHLLHKVNSRSKLMAISNTASIQRGNRDLIALAINAAGGAGQALGTIAEGTVIPVQRDYGIYCGTPTSPVTTNMITDSKLIATLACVIKDQADKVANGEVITNQITATSTIEVIDLTTAGSAANVTSVIYLGLDTNQAAYFDNVPQVTNEIEVRHSEAFQVYPIAKESCCRANEGVGQGWKWTIDSDDRYQLSVHTMQNHPFMEYFSKGVTYIDPNKVYTSYIIDYSDYEETLSFESEYPKQLIILLEGSVTVADVTTAVAELNANGTPFVTTTNDAATVADLNAIFGAWLESARQYTNHQLLGEATSAAYFV